MALVAGASQYLSQAAYSIQFGQTFDAGNVLSFGASDLLEIGRANRVRGVGLSSRARALNQSQIQANVSAFNQLFSLSGGGSATVESALIQIKGLQATVPASRIIGDDGGITESLLGSEIDETV